MATRAYIVDITDENTAEMIYNHFDGGEYLNKALNQNQIDPDDIFPAIGDIRLIKLENGPDGEEVVNIERYKEGGTIIVRGEDIDDTMQRVIDKFQTGGVNYLQVYNRMDRNGKNNYHSWSMIKKSTFDKALGELKNIVKIENTDMNENYESKWKKFINEDQQLDGFTDDETDDFKKIISNMESALHNQNKSSFEIEAYTNSVKNDFYRDFYAAIDKYYEFNDRKIIDDFDNYMNGDLDN